MISTILRSTRSRPSSSPVESGRKAGRSHLHPFHADTAPPDRQSVEQYGTEQRTADCRRYPHRPATPRTAPYITEQDEQQLRQPVEQKEDEHDAEGAHEPSGGIAPGERICHTTGHGKPQQDGEHDIRHTGRAPAARMSHMSQKRIFAVERQRHEQDKTSEYHNESHFSSAARPKPFPTAPYSNRTDGGEMRPDDRCKDTLFRGYATVPARRNDTGKRDQNGF